jgi:hypothetical protein
VAHIAGIVVTAEREVMFGFEPAVVGAPSLAKGLSSIMGCSSTSEVGSGYAFPFDA